MIFDIIIGKTLPTKYNYNYLQTVYANRINDEIDDGDLAKLVEVIYNSLNNAFTEPPINTAVEEIINEFGEMDAKYRKSVEVNMGEIRIRELLSALSFNGYEFYLIKRNDLTSLTEIDSRTRAYMVDKNDSYFPSINRVVNGTSIVFDDTAEASISTVVMQFMKDLRFNDIVENQLDLDSLRDKYEALEEAHMGFALNIDNLIEFLDDYGYEFVVAV